MTDVYQLAEEYDCAVVEWWSSGIPGERCEKARKGMEDARARMVAATRGGGAQETEMERG